jgi:hypothetical protein
VSGNLSIAALFVANAFNRCRGDGRIAHRVGTAGWRVDRNMTAAAQLATPTAPANNDRPSVIIVEVLSYGGGDGTPQQQPGEENRRKSENHRSQIDGDYDPYSPVYLLGTGDLTDKQKKKLTADEKAKLEILVGKSDSF